jgi:hypothetical protein
MQKENNPVAEQLRAIRDLLDSVITSIDSDGAHPKAARKRQEAPKNLTVDFELPERAFFSRYAQTLSGPERFALIVAYLAKGDETKDILMRDVSDRWGKMTSLLGTFNPAHTTRARDKDFVSSRSKGSYHLRPNWGAIIR